MSAIDTYPKIVTAAENALIVYFADQASSTVISMIRTVESQLAENLQSKLIDLVPSYTSLLLIYDALQTDHFFVSNLLRQVISQVNESSYKALKGRCITLPVYYAEETGPDLSRIASEANLSIAQVIELHCNQSYLVYSIGFAPGFAYLGEVNPLIASPRIPTPRQKVPKGAVAIADRQTAVYPSQSPGGWNIIGNCPTNLFNLSKDPPIPFAIGDRVTFDPISRADYLACGGRL